VSLEWGPLSLTEELLGRKSSGSGLETREYGRRDPQKLPITSPTSGGRSVGIVRSRTQTMEFFLSLRVQDRGTSLKHIAKSELFGPEDESDIFLRNFG
jgi:hypothetical protein